MSFSGNGNDIVGQPTAFLDQLIGTAILVFVVFALTTAWNNPPLANLGPLFVGLLVVAIGMAWGANAGYAINPARDLGPRIAHAVLPIRGKGSSDWAYAWVPVVGPLIGAVLAGGFYQLYANVPA